MQITEINKLICIVEKNNLFTHTSPYMNNWFMINNDEKVVSGFKLCSTSALLLSRKYYFF